MHVYIMCINNMTNDVVDLKQIIFITLLRFKVFKIIFTCKCDILFVYSFVN